MSESRGDAVKQKTVAQNFASTLKVVSEVFSDCMTRKIDSNLIVLREVLK